MPPNEPRIIPPDRRLLGGRLDDRRPILGEPNQLPDPYREGSTAEAPSLTTPYDSPIEPPVATGRRLTIYYQNQGGGNGFIQNTPAVAPQIDQGIDIAKPLLNQFAEYAEDRSQVNSIPILGMPVQKAGFGKSQNIQQRTYTDSLPEAAKIDLNTNPTIVNGLDTNLIDTAIITPDPLGVYYHDRRAPRKFRITDYQNGINTGPTGNQEHKSNVDRMLYQTRGHYDNLPFVTTDTTVPPKDKDNKIRLGSYFYKELGSFASGSYVRTNAATNPNPAFTSLTVEQMKNIGLNIMFEAAQGQAGFDFTIKNDNPSAIAEAEARMALPSEQRLGKRVSLGRFTPAYQIKKLTGVEKPANSSFIDNTDDIQTYGSFYNVYNQFDSLVPVGQIALCVALILAFTTSLSLLAAALQQNSNRDARVVNPSLEERARLRGTSILQNNPVYPTTEVTAGNFFTQIFGMNNTFNYTTHTWGQCLSYGIQEFFGFSYNATGLPAGSQAVNTSLKVLTESGRLNVILREILRSGISLVEGSIYDPSQLAAFSAAGNLIEKIRDLKIVKFINVLITIGDRVSNDIEMRIASRLNDQNDANQSTPAAGTSYVDSLPDSRPFYISKSRLSSDRGLAWSNKTAGAAMLPLFLDNPKAFGQAGLLGSRDQYSTHWSEMGITVREVGDNTEQIANVTRDERIKAIENDRLPDTVVKKVEDALESDYMPFYLHDLRTNEILAFHAFLEDANEDFGIEYSAQDGYGRMDKVQIYKSTTRNISVNFKMVATNEDDHDMMWYKINRLAMMIYPQWTQGRKISAGDFNFIQPLSQIPGATPVVRLRLGDLYKSNYSKMAVARLFGVTTLEDYNVSSNTDRVNYTRGLQANPRSVNRTGQVSSTAPAPNAPTDTPEIAGIREKIANIRNNNLLFSYSTSNNVPNPRNQRRARNSRRTIAIDSCFSPGDEIALYALNKINIINQDAVNNAFQRLGVDSLPLPEAAISFENYGRASTRQATTAAFRNANSKYRFFGTYLGRSVAGAGILGNRNEETVRVRITKFTTDYTDLDSILNATRRSNVTQNIDQPFEIVLRASELNLPRVIDRQLTAQLLERRIQTIQEQARQQEQIEAEQAAAQRAAAQQELARQNLLSPQRFYDETKNPIIKAFNSTKGKGLAGVITSFKVDYGEAKGSWGIVGEDFLRAPKFVSVQLTMAVIHDITPGLDAKGIMNAPIWPVGRRSNFFVNNGTENQSPSEANTTPVSGQPVKNEPDQNYYENRRWAEWFDNVSENMLFESGNQRTISEFIRRGNLFRGGGG